MTYVYVYINVYTVTVTVAFRVDAIFSVKTTSTWCACIPTQILPCSGVTTSVIFPSFQKPPFGTTPLLPCTAPFTQSMYIIFRRARKLCNTGVRLLCYYYYYFLHQTKPNYSLYKKKKLINKKRTTIILSL